MEQTKNELKRIFVLLLSGLALLACGQKEGRSPGTIDIRIANNSAYRFEEVYVKGPRDAHQYGAIAPGGSSAYKPFAVAYQYAYLKLKINGEEFILQPYDYSGEDKLTAGKYTYAVSIHDYQDKRLVLHCKKD